MDSLGALPGHARSEARGVSADGSVVVGRSAVGERPGIFPPGDPSQRAFSWSPDTGTRPLVGLVSPEGWSAATGVSADGATMVGNSLDASGVPLPVRWVSGRVESLVLPPGDAHSGGALGISGDGNTVLGYAGVPQPNGSEKLVYVRWRLGVPSMDLGDQFGLSAQSQTSVSDDGTVTAVSTSRDRLVRWQMGVGAVPLRIAPSWLEALRAECECPTFLGGLGLTGDGLRIVGSTWQPGRPGRLLDWVGFRDGNVRSMTSVSNPPLSRVVASRTGMLCAGMEGRFTLEPNPDIGRVLVPYGSLPLLPLLAAQGADVGAFASLTNVTAISPDGQWIVGSGKSSTSGQPEAFRAKLVLHAAGEVQLATESVEVENGIRVHRLRWPVRDLKVVVESCAALNPSVPWVAEAGDPRIEEHSLVLDLPQSTEQRYFRLRRVD
ncbi:MAG: hypothetical protein JNL10_08265 [Verrucomicrobiales bacterium]|nr:hypothetical protein [Verrucomicrobiales bacterium]